MLPSLLIQASRVLLFTEMLIVVVFANYILVTACATNPRYATQA